MNDRQQQIRERAYHLWEKAGYPWFRDEEFWHQAEKEIMLEEIATSGDTTSKTYSPDSSCSET